MATFTLYGIPTCQSCKKARSLLEGLGVAVEWVDLRAKPPNRTRLKAWMAQFGAKALRNTSGGSYRRLPADKNEWNESQWFEAFLGDPMLIKRPVLEVDGKPVMVGFKPEQLESLAGRA